MAFTAFVSTYPPHRCGIATFTSDLASSVGPHQVVALHPVSGPAAYPSVVRHRIRRDSRGDYLAAAAALNASDVEVVSIQHEYGIWGGDDGAYVLDFVRALDVPVVTTLHTVLRTPTPSQRRILTRTRGHVGHDRGHVQGGRLTARRGPTAWNRGASGSCRTACRACRWSIPTPSSRTSASRAGW